MRPDDSAENPSKIMELNLKFAKGYKYLNDKYPNDPELNKLVEMVKEYSHKLDMLGLSDVNVRKSETGKIRFLVGAVALAIRIIAGLVLVFGI